MNRHRWIIGIATVTFIGTGALINAISSSNLLSKFVSVIFTTLGVTIPILQVVFPILPGKTNYSKISYTGSYSSKYKSSILKYLIGILWPIFVILVVLLGGVIIISNVRQAVGNNTFYTVGQTYSVNLSNDQVAAIAWSPDSKYLASGSGNGTVQLWNANTGIGTFYYCSHSSSAVWALDWSPDGKRIASGSVDGTVQVWNASTGDSILVYRGHTAAVDAVAWSPDGKHIASGSDDDTVQVWDKVTGHTFFSSDAVNKC